MGHRAHRNTRERKRLGPGAVRRLRIVAVSSLVLLVAAAGAGALWLSTRASEPRPVASRAERPSLQPPIRLDTLPRARSSEPPRNTKSSSEAARTKERRRQTADSAAGANGDRSGQEIASKAEIKRELAALAQENDRIEAALSDDMGPGLGSGEVVWPSSGRITARFGRRLGPLHAGIDIGVPAGTPVHAADSGRVVISGVMGGYGKYVCIQHTGTLSTCYAHNSRLRVRKGESVDSGDVISKSGCTGRCYGDHLHFEVRDRGRAVNPREYLGPLAAGRPVSGGLP